MEPKLKALLESLEELKGAPVSEECGCPVFVIPPESLPAAAKALKTKADLKFDHLSLYTAVDHGDHIELICVLDSAKLGASVQLKVLLHPIEPKSPTLTDVWPAANWLEREMAEMFSVKFEGHPDMRNLLLLPNFRGYPLLKRFTATDPEGLFD